MTLFDITSVLGCDRAAAAPAIPDGAGELVGRALKEAGRELLPMEYLAAAQVSATLAVALEVRALRLQMQVNDGRDFVVGLR